MRGTTTSKTWCSARLRLHSRPPNWQPHNLWLIPVLQLSRTQMSKSLVWSLRYPASNRVPRGRANKTIDGILACLGWLFDGWNSPLRDHHHLLLSYIFCRIRRMNFIRQFTWIYIIIAAWFCEQNSPLAVLYSPVLPFSQWSVLQKQSIRILPHFLDKI